jgi:hypothetical protein
MIQSIRSFGFVFAIIGAAAACAPEGALDTAAGMDAVGKGSGTGACTCYCGPQQQTFTRLDSGMCPLWSGAPCVGSGTGYGSSSGTWYSEYTGCTT